MIAEAYKLVTSVFPFVKEAFLWRDGAEVGKPITSKNLLRRKIAVFVLLASLGVNYLALDKLYKDYVLEKELKSQIAALKLSEDDLEIKLEILKQTSSSCIKPTDVLQICQQEIEVEIKNGLLKRAWKPRR